MRNKKFRNSAKQFVLCMMVVIFKAMLCAQNVCYASDEKDNNLTPLKDNLVTCVSKDGLIRTCFGC